MTQMQAIVEPARDAKRSRQSFGDSFDFFHRRILAFLFFANVFDLGGGFLLKYLSYLLMFLAIFLQHPRERLSVEALALFSAVFVVIPALSLLVGASNGGDLVTGLGQITPFLPAFVLFIYMKPSQADFAWDAWYTTMRYFAAIVISLFGAMILLEDAGVSKQIADVLNNAGQGYFGIRTFGALTIPNVYFKATLFLVPAFAYALFLGHRLNAALFFTAVLLAFSKAAFVFCCILLLLYWFRNVALGNLSLPAILLLSIFGVGAFLLADEYFVNYLSQIFDALSGVSDTTAVRIGHTKSVFGLFAENPDYLVLGQGVGTAFHSMGTMSMVTDIELDHLDAMRQFGLIWFFVFLMMFMTVIRTLMLSSSDSKRAAGIAVFGLFLVAGTNPVLINPLSLMLLVVAWKACSIELQKTGRQPGSKLS